MYIANGSLLMLTCLSLALLPGLATAASGDDEREAAVARARAELARTLNTDPDGFELESIEPIGVASSGLRCGRPLPLGDGGSGWQVHLRQGGRTFDVRVAGKEAAVCLFGEAAGASPSVGPPAEPRLLEGGLAAQTESARADLAGRLGITHDEIEVVESVSVTWPDASAGCPLPKRGYAQVLTPGVLIRLRSAQRTYQYHGRRGREPFLCNNPSPIAPTRVETE